MKRNSRFPERTPSGCDAYPTSTEDGTTCAPREAKVCNLDVEPGLVLVDGQVKEEVGRAKVAMDHLRHVVRTCVRKSSSVGRFILGGEVLLCRG